MQPVELYDRILEDRADASEIEAAGMRLVVRAMKDVRGTAEQRGHALKVGQQLGSRLGLPIAMALITAPEAAVRAGALGIAKGAREDGLPVLREALRGAGDDTVCEALALLQLRSDPASAIPARRLLVHKSAAVRRAAASLLGQVAGRGTVVDLRKSSLGDPDESVREAAKEAMKQIEGTAPRAERGAWWSDDEPEPESTPKSTPKASAPAAATPPAKPSTELVPTTKPNSPEPDPTPPPAEVASWEIWASMPSQMPTETQAAVKLLGLIAPSDHAKVMAIVEAADAAELGALFAPAANDPGLARGVCIAVGSLERMSLLSRVIRWISSVHPQVREAAVTATGLAGAASSLPALRNALVDPDVAVRASAVRAMTNVAERTNKAAFAKPMILGMQEDASERVRTEVAAALERLA